MNVSLIGVLAVENIAVGAVENHAVKGPLLVFPGEQDALDALQSMPAASIGEQIVRQIRDAAGEEEIEAVGIGFPGITHGGIIEDSPNLQQVKGMDLRDTVARALSLDPQTVHVYNDADVIAAGIAATRGHLDKFIRVWTLGHGIGFGRFPWAEGAWEGGHTVVSLDPKEGYCGCGGKGHLEGIMGHRAMRLRFLDLEPEEVFESAREGDTRCRDFVRLWHRALAAATANSIHVEGPGKFFLTGPNSRFVDLAMLEFHLREMVKMSPLQGSVWQVISTSVEIGVIGAAENARRALRH